MELAACVRRGFAADCRYLIMVLMGAGEQGRRKRIITVFSRVLRSPVKPLAIAERTALALVLAKCNQAEELPQAVFLDCVQRELQLFLQYAYRFEPPAKLDKRVNIRISSETWTIVR